MVDAGAVEARKVPHKLFPVAIKSATINDSGGISNSKGRTPAFCISRDSDDSIQYGK
jgi:hypothetical protein